MHMQGVDLGERSHSRKASLHNNIFRPLLETQLEGRPLNSVGRAALRMQEPLCALSWPHT